MQASDVNVVSSCKTAAKICSRRHSHFASRERKNTANLPYKPRSGQSTSSEHVGDTFSFSLFFFFPGLCLCTHAHLAQSAVLLLPYSIAWLPPLL